MKREKLKIFGFYALAALLLLRLVIVPYQNTIKEKKALLREYEDTYRMRAASFERFRQEATRNIKTTGAEDPLLQSVFGKDIPVISIQSEIVKDITDFAEKNEITIVSFEFPDPIPFKGTSEVPVTLRMKGEQKGLVALLRNMEKWHKRLVVKRFEEAKEGPAVFCMMTVSAYKIGNGQ